MTSACAAINVNLRHPAGYFGHNRNGPIEQRRRIGRRVIIEDHRDQRDREHETGDDAKSQFEPNRIERDLVAEALSLPVAAVEIVRKYRQKRAEKQLKHGSSPRSW